jgi:hypothetical protein
MSKRPYGHGDIRLMGGFKAVSLDYEFWLSNGTEGALYCLDQRDISILLALCEYVGWFTRWHNTDDISAAEVLAIQGELEQKLMSCVDIQVLIDQAQLTASREATNQLVQSQGVRDELADRYDGTPTSINPSAPTTNFGSSGDRYTALCAAITAFVYKFALEEVNVLRIGEVGGLAAIGLAVGLLIPGLNVFLLVGAGIAVLLGAGLIGVSTETAIAALTDQAALDDVICFMRDTLKAQSVTEAHWNACLNSYPFGVGTHQAIVADFIKATLADNYLPVLDMLGQGYDSVLANDDLPDCPCAPPPDCFDFSIDQQGWIHPSVGDAQYAPTVGWGQIYNTYLTIDSPQDGTIIHSVKIKFSRAWTGSSDYDKFFVNLYNWGGSGNFQTTLGGGLSIGSEITIVNTTGADWTDLRIQVAAGGYTFPPNGSNPTAQFITEVCYDPD